MVKNTTEVTSFMLDGKTMIYPYLLKSRIYLLSEDFLLLVEKFKSEGINGHISGYLIEHTFATVYIYTASLPYKMTITAHSYIGDNRLYEDYLLKSHLERLSVSTTF